MDRGYRPGDPLRLVFQFELDSFDRRPLEALFKQFNLGAAGLARHYRARGLRSLSKGDVLTFDDTLSWAVGGYSWDRLDIPLTDTTQHTVQAERDYSGR